MALISCSECGQLVSDKANACPHCGNPNVSSNAQRMSEDNSAVSFNSTPVQQNQGYPYQSTEISPVLNNETKEGTWSIGRLVIGILSILASCGILFQSCLAGFGNALLNNASFSGTIGFFCALFMLSAGIINIAGRRSPRIGANVAALVLYTLGLLVTFCDIGDYQDLIIWGSLSFSFGIVNLGSLIMMRQINISRTTRVIETVLFALFSVAVFIGVSVFSVGLHDGKFSSTKNEIASTDRPQRHAESWVKYNLGSYQVSVPNYWNPNSDTVQNNNLYAENGDKLAVLYIDTNSAGKGVSFDYFSKTNEYINDYLSTRKAKLIKRTEVSDCKVNNVVWHYEFESSGKKFDGWQCVFYSEDKNDWIIVVLSYSENTEYLYSIDFYNMIRKVQRN